MLLVTGVVFVLGVAAWAGGYLKFDRKLPQRDPSRGIASIPGLLLVVLSFILFAFYWHWVVGGLSILAIGYIGYRLIFPSRL